MDSPARAPLAFHYDGRAVGWLVPLMLITSLTCNIAALSIPFLEMRVWPGGPENYSIPHTIHLMWSEFKLYLIAVLIAGFSLIFPFVKLSMLGLAWFAPVHDRTRARLLGALGALGRWSLLDVFVALVLIVLAHHQGTLFVTGVKPGLGLFLSAIVLAMITGDLMHHLHDRATGETPIGKEGRASFAWLVWCVPILGLGALGTLIAALQAPYLKITAWFLDDAEYSILGTIRALFEEREFAFGFTVAAFLVVTPSLRIVLIGLAWFRRHSAEKLGRLSGAIRLVDRWCMLDVFGLAIGLFLLEGSNLVPIEKRGGVWLLVVAVAASVLLAKASGLLISWSVGQADGAAAGGENPS